MVQIQKNHGPFSFSGSHICAKSSLRASVDCTFCIDMNSFEYEKNGISEEEMQGLISQMDAI